MNESPPLIPRELIFGNPDRTQPRLSPDGKLLAWIAPDEGVLNVWAKTVGQDDEKVVTRDRGRGIRIFFWAPGGDSILYLQDKDGDENWRLYDVPPGGGRERDLTPFDKIQARIVAREYDIPDRILIGINQRDPQFHDVFSLNLKDGSLTLEVQNDIHSMGWIADHRLCIRIAEAPTPDGGFKLLHRAPDGTEWREILRWGGEDSVGTSAANFAGDNRTLFLRSSVGTNTSEFRALDLETLQETVIASDPHFDNSGHLQHPRTHQMQAVRFERDRSEWLVLDEAIREHFDRLARLHRGDFFVVSRDREDRTWLVGYLIDNYPVVYYTYDLASGQGTYMFSSRKDLENYTLAGMNPIRITARDGLEIPCYLTLPLGAPARNLPAVVNIHGGPWVRDSWGFDPEAQWLANRGYAVLQVNYRGSTGYGKSYVNAADKEWGGKMQDDVTDATRWLIEQGIADPKRVAIFGGSYGGYATLSGLVKEPDLYACGVDIVGPGNLFTWLNTFPPYWEPYKPVVYRRVGHPEKDAELLRERSPLFHVDRIQAPLLMAQGANDPRVPRAESIQMRDALLKAGKQVEYMEFPDEGHGFARPENRLKFYAVAERFLAKHLGGRVEDQR